MTAHNRTDTINSGSRVILKYLNKTYTDVIILQKVIFSLTTYLKEVRIFDGKHAILHKELTPKMGQSDKHLFLREKLFKHDCYDIGKQCTINTDI